MATASVKEDKLGDDILLVPPSKREEIRQQRSKYRESIINYYMFYSPYASWTWLAGRLYYLEEHEALSAVKKFIKGTRGKCVYIYLYDVMSNSPSSNVNCGLVATGEQNTALPLLIRIFIVLN